jgi:hypothetical protein
LLGRSAARRDVVERPLRDDDGEMERVLEKKAELIGQYEDEKAQTD